MREINSDRSETSILGLEEKKIETKEETINRGGKKEKVGAKNQHLDLERKKEGKEAGVGPDRRLRTTFPSFTPSREDLEGEESLARFGRLMPGSWTISKCIRSKSPPSPENMIL
jgi:hypothetical protein